MPLEQALIDLMLDEVTLELFTGVDRYNNRLYSAPFPAQCQITVGNKLAIGEDGRELTSTVSIIFADPTMALTTDARLTLPDGTRPAIIQVLSAKDDVGPYYLEARA